MKGLISRGLLLGSLLAFSIAASGNSQVQIPAPGTFIWTIHPPSQADIQIGPNGVEIAGWQTTLNAAGLKVPVLSKLVYTRGREPAINVIRGQLQALELDRTFSPLREQAKGAELEFRYQQQPMANTEYSLEKIGNENGLTLWSVSIYALNIDPADPRVYLPQEKISVEIRSDHHLSVTNADEELYLNCAPPLEVLTKTAASGLGQGKVKFYILRDGIYRIYYDDIEDLEAVSGQSIPSRTLRLFNLGKEQPIYVRDGRDGIFDSGDYFDFLGTQNYYSGDSQYYDPFSDVNVYWLDWGGTNGKRFIEESGALVSDNPVQPTSFWDIAHLEEDIYFDRLGQVDTDLPTITRDHYFWTSINSGKSSEVEFIVPDPARGSSENLQIQIGLHGLTYKGDDGLGGDHSVFAFINENSVGSASWSQQEEYTLSSPASLNLSHNILSAAGSNKLEIFVPVSTQAGVYDKYSNGTV